MKNINIRKCTIDDLLCLQELSIKTYVQTFEKFNSSKIMKKYLQDAFNLEKLKNELLDNNSLFYFMFNDTRIVGYLKLNQAPSQTDINDNLSLEIQRFYILKEYQGIGFGKVLLHKALEVAIENKKEYVWLGVWEHNEKAKHFYKKAGFYKIGEHSFYMGNDNQTDYLMRKDLVI